MRYPNGRVRVSRKCRSQQYDIDRETQTPQRAGARRLRRKKQPGKSFTKSVRPDIIRLCIETMRTPETDTR